jgi:uncharacterized membrane protein (DUF441 family)
MTTIATSKNLTILGICTIVAALANAGVSYIQTKTVDFAILLTAISAGVAMIMGKGAESTGGTVDGAGNPVK